MQDKLSEKINNSKKWLYKRFSLKIYVFWNIPLHISPIQEWFWKALWKLLYYTRISRFAGFISTMRTLPRGRVQKTNKSELWNHLTYRVLIYIFEVGMKTFFFSTEKFRGRNPNLKKIKKVLIIIF